MKTLKTVGFLAVFFTVRISSAGANVNVGLYDTVHIVPAPGPIAIDGKLDDWDKSGAFTTYRFEDQKDRYGLTGMMMYDPANLYIAAHVVDRSPMMNMYDPDAEGTTAWNGDCLQVRLSTDRALSWPVNQPMSNSDGIAHLTMWYYTPKSRPCLMIQYGMNFHGQVVNPPGFQGAYIKDPDGHGYTLEYAIPWSLLHAGADPPKAGESFACIWQMLWSDDQGRHYVADLSEIRNSRDNSLAYQSAGGWGRALYEPKGHLAAGTVAAIHGQQSTPTQTGFFPIRYRVSGAKAADISMKIVDSKGRTVKWMLGAAPRKPGVQTELWNGLDDDNNPVPPGKYTVLWSQGKVDAKLVATANNPGHPPYNTSDNRGSWAGDYGWPTAVTASDTNIFLGHMAGEASRTVIKVTPEGQRIWGIDPTLDLGPHVIDMANDGKSLYILYGNIYGDPCSGGFVKINCDTGYNEAIGTMGKSSLTLTTTDATGPTAIHTMSAITVDSTTVYVASEQDGKILRIDKKTGARLADIDGLDKPRGLAIGPDGRLYVVTPDKVQVMSADGSNLVNLVVQLPEAHRIAVSKTGQIYVTVQGVYNQVMRFDAAGKGLGTIGLRGGLVVPGKWRSDAMLRPFGICIAPDGNLWVTEERMNPKRTSVWKPDGSFVTDYCGPVPYASTCVMDPEDPDHIYSENTQFAINYKTGETHPSAVVYDDGKFGQNGPVSGFWEVRFIHFGGRTFVTRSAGDLWEWVNGRFIPRVQFTLVKPIMTGNPYWPQSMMMQIDQNGDGTMEPGEMQFCPVVGGAGWLGWVADNLDIYCGDSYSLYRLPFEGFDPRGVPIYNMEHIKLLLSSDKAKLAANKTARPFPMPGSADCWMVDSNSNLYVLMNTGQDRIKRGQPYLDKGHCIIKFSPSLDLVWTYRNVVVGMGASWNTTISKPGEILGAMRFTGQFGRYITVNSYFGQYHIIDSQTGLYVASLTPDTRTDPPLDSMTILTENFNGCAVYAPSIKKYLYCGGDADARIWEVNGLDDIVYHQFNIIVDDAAHRKAVDASRAIYGLPDAASGQKVISARSAYITPDGDLSDWQGSDWADFTIDAARHGRASVNWTQDTVSVAFDVIDDSPLLNRGGNPNLLFRTGDAVEFDLSTADQSLSRPDDRPILGDKRILLSVVKDAQGVDKPIAMLYEPRSSRPNANPGTFTSPVSSVTYDNVSPIPAVIGFKRTTTGYTLEARFNASDLGLGQLEVGQRYRADFGALFSDRGGAMVLAKTLWSDNSPEVSVTNDIPTEAKIRPNHWGWIVLH